MDSPSAENNRKKMHRRISELGLDSVPDNRLPEFVEKLRLKLSKQEYGDRLGKDGEQKLVSWRSMALNAGADHSIFSRINSGQIPDDASMLRLGLYYEFDAEWMRYYAGIRQDPPLSEPVFEEDRELVVNHLIDRIADLGLTDEELSDIITQTKHASN